MIKLAIPLAMLLVITPLVSSAEISSDQARNWHQWRGPSGNGLSTTADPPVEWSESKNVKWKVAVPGRGSATPIIWNDRLFLLTAIATDRRPKGAPAVWVTLLKGTGECGLLLIGSDIADADPRLLLRKASSQFPHHLIVQFGSDDEHRLWLAVAGGRRCMEWTKSPSPEG